MATPADPPPFLSRWAQRKALAREGATLPAEPPPPKPLPAPVPAPVAPTATAEPAAARAAPVEAPPPPTLVDAAMLSPGAEVSRFVAQGVAPEVKNAALKKLFADPHFNVMDGLDTYIDDYNKPDPLPLAMLRQMRQADVLGLFDKEPDPEPDATVPAPTPPAHEDPDLRLQPDDAAGPAGPAASAGEDPARQH